MVGAFFVLSGYVAGYTATELGRYEASARVRPAWAYTVARVAGYYPLYALVQLLFGAMFVYADNFYNGPVATAAHGVLSFVLAQAWFPAHAEVWNAPTWFLSALSFSMLVLPHALPAVAALRARGLRTLLGALTGLSLLAKLAYSYDLGTWGLLEGVARSHPNLLLWNVTRFHPFYCLLEVLMGVAAARIVMLDSVDAEGGAATPPPPGSALLPLAGLVAVTVARAAGWLPLNDPLTRGLLFIPLFLLLLVRLHRNTLAGKGQGVGLARVLAHPALTYLGTLSFPVFVVHGALGQLFYKKVVATKARRLRRRPRAPAHTARHTQLGRSCGLAWLAAASPAAPSLLPPLTPSPPPVSPGVGRRDAALLLPRVPAGRAGGSRGAAAPLRRKQKGAGGHRGGHKAPVRPLLAGGFARIEKWGQDWFRICLKRFGFHNLQNRFADLRHSTEAARPPL